MNHRERLLAALNHETPDRVPIDLGSTRNTGILQAPYEKLVAYLGLGEDEGGDETHGISKVLGLATPDEALLRHLDIDTRGIFLGKPDRSMERLLPDGRHMDAFGVVRRRPEAGHYFDVVRSPLDGEITLSDIARWPWPDPTDPGYVRGLREKAQHLRETTDYAVVLHFSDIMVHTSQYMRGFENWYMDLLLAPDLAGALMDAIVEVRLEIARRALEEVADLVDVVSCSDDVADQRGPQMSLEHYRRLIKPRHARYLELIRSMTSAKILYHSCGAVFDLIPDFLDMGVDAINPVQVSAQGMDTARLKATYGDRLAFWGGVDTMRVLPFGTPDEVRAEVRQRILDLSGDGGYVLTAVHNIQPDVPPENIVALYQSAAMFNAAEEASE
ncbi:MAG: uroporphyrinogen decarboxylase family protein [Anaerolineae bacterium]